MNSRTAHDTLLKHWEIFFPGMVWWLITLEEKKYELENIAIEPTKFEA